MNDIEASSGKAVFVNSGPEREERVQNAMKFLSQPRVRGSPVIYRRTFLEKKGLRKEEIDEAFRRTPDLTPSHKAASNSIGKGFPSKSSKDNQPQVSLQALQPTGAVASLRRLNWHHFLWSHTILAVGVLAASGAASAVFLKDNQPQVSLQALQPTGAVASLRHLSLHHFRWSHAILAIGVLAASGAATALFLKNLFTPRLRSWCQKNVSREDNDVSKGNCSRATLVESQTSCGCGKSKPENVKFKIPRNEEESDSDISDCNYQPPPEKIAEAQKAAKFAVGALAFDDVSAALDYLRKSVELLKNPLEDP